MTELTRIIGLTPQEAAAVHERAVAGDPASLRLFTLWSAWHFKIKRDRRYSYKAAREVLRFLIDNCSVSIATPEEIQEAEKSSLAPIDEGLPDSMPWFGSGPPPAVS